ncbi:tRNA 2-thiouridine(34) synthase MnmA [Azospirillum sp. RWY-5-1]|uniref:tRNA-specific 2-thiouridylase MnmA n=1 Tax=Azospirillum oleiclasticum TaxID=2735135 RepID=A0ABX2TBU4_9PROT|nr:tRNA 2-thiouridine(34) synthase MnmA [Azospirillum oleiclasticum]NYZ13531.1 tRNA 2-thiouridine(34) synthase MnmA [Azospirillum oleiclasticum]NYZ20692.1 tRNA 2-thiouridine(34) synthase MnmA [Azospirillum oleiclasticum]
MLNSLGIPKAPADTRVVVAMSGGVDSSVTAALLREEGYDVVGVTLQLYDHGMAVQRKGACCAGQDIYDARQVADRIGIPHYVLDYEGRFGQDVIDDFADSYLRGETPIPCVRCNQRVKFRDLLGTARDLGADALATGHYVRRVDGPAGPELRRAADPARDQSYFLFATTRDQLDFLRFPLGHLPKTETRALAERYALPVAAKPDSQDICFVPDGSYADVVTKLRPGAAAPGDIVHVDGRVLGRHEGIVHYTIGQRKGLGIGGLKDGAGHTDSDPLYVIRLDAPTRRVVVGPRDALARTVVYLRDLNWLAPLPAPGTAIPAQVKLRSAQPPAAATLTLGEDGTAEVRLADPQHGIAPGQACVAYDGDRVLGGGWIAATAP